MSRRQSITRPALAFFLCIGSAIASQAKALSEEQSDVVLGHLQTCAKAISEESSAAFDNWTTVEGNVPGSYMSYKRFVSADSDFRAFFGQQRKMHGPFECGVIYQGKDQGVLNGLKYSDIGAFLLGLDNVVLAEHLFERKERFEGRINNRNMSACINGRWLLVGADASIAADGTYHPMYRIGPPLLEDAGCEAEKG